MLGMISIVFIEHSNILYSAPTAKNIHLNLFTKKTVVYYENRVDKNELCEENEKLMYDNANVIP